MSEHTKSVPDHESLQGKHITKSTPRNCLCGKFFVPKNMNDTEELCASCVRQSAVSILDDDIGDDNHTDVQGFSLRRELDCNDCC